MGEFLKNDFVGFSDLEAAFEAVKGLIFGPADPGYIKHKFNEIVKDAKDKRELESNPLSLFGHARDERETRDRRDRDHENMTLTVLLANNAAYRAAWEKAMNGLPELGNAMDDFQDKIEALLAKEKALLKVDLERVAGRLPDGRYVFKGADGSIVGEDLQPLKAEDAEAAKAVDFTGKMTLEEYRERKGKIDRLETIADDNRRGRVEIGDIHAKLTDPKNPAQSEEEVKDLGARKEAEKDLFDERVKEFGILASPVAKQPVEKVEGMSLMGLSGGVPKIAG